MRTKRKLTITIDTEVLNSAKTICRQKHLSLSGVIENFLKFFVKPKLYCFKCGREFTSDADICLKCDWLICPNCKTCGCNFDSETIQAIYQMRRTYEEILIGRVK